MPKAMVHVKILDAARARPRASIQGIAEEIDGASIDLVERVLDEYGDPGEPNAETDSAAEAVGEGTDSTQDDRRGTEQPMNADQPDSTSETIEPTGEPNSNSNGAATQSPEAADDRTDLRTERADADVRVEDAARDDDAEPSDASIDETGPSSEDHLDGAVETVAAPTPEQLSSKQLDVLRAIQERPHATQSELGEQFGVSRATISQRVNAIDGFEWPQRKELVDAVFDGAESPSEPDRRVDVGDELATSIDTLAERVAALERTVDEVCGPRDSTFDDPATVGTIIRACIDSNTVPEDDEEEIIVKLIEAGRT